MVRLEKLVYEQVVNSAATARLRKVGAPRKWNHTNPYEHMAYLGYNVFHDNFIGRLIRPIYERWSNSERAFQRDLMLQQGLTFEDRFLHHDIELRRHVLFEHMARESLHPYQWVLKARRRERYFKVQRGIKGFFVPEYIRSQAKSQTYSDYLRLKKQWNNFTHNNYWSDMTPSPARTVIPRLFLLELPLNYGLFRSEAWSRYFMSETDDSWYSEKQLAKTRNSAKFPFDLSTAQGKKDFQAEISEYNEKNPGMVAIEGQKFDFKAYYNEIGV